MKKIVLALAVCATIASCQKKEDTDPIDVSKSTYLMNGKWQLKAFTWLPDINDSTSFETDQYEALPGCEKDNYYVFNTLNRVSLYDNMTKCNISAPDSIVYGYVLSNNDNYLEVYTNPDDVNHVNVLYGSVTYESIDSFLLTNTQPHPVDSTKTSRYKRLFVKIP